MGVFHFKTLEDAWNRSSFVGAQSAVAGWLRTIHGSGQAHDPAKEELASHERSHGSDQGPFTAKDEARSQENLECSTECSECSNSTPSECSTVSCGPPGQPDLFSRLPRGPLGTGSTSEVFEWICCRDVPCEQETGSFRIFERIESGAHVAVKCFAYSTDCIGSCSAGPHPPNYPTKLTTGIKERIIGASLAAAHGPGKDHVSALLASWFDQQGLWLVFRLVPSAAGLDEVLAPGSPAREALCAQPLPRAAALFRQFALALQFLDSQGVTHRDGGLGNWLVSDLDAAEPNVVLIDFGLALHSDSPLTEPDTAPALLRHLWTSERASPDPRRTQNMVDAAACGEHLDMQRLNPIDWCYAPGAAGPKFPPPPELRVLREELPSSAAEALKERGCRLPYSSGYDVWVLGWTFIQIILGERWEDWKAGHEVPGYKDDPLVQHVRSSFFDKKRQVETPWELGSQPPAWRLEALARGPAAFRACFLDGFLRLAGARIRALGAAATPLQAAFALEGSPLRETVLRMIDFDAERRQAYLRSGELLRDLEALATEDA